MPKARRSEAAERDLQDIAFHIALSERRPLAADRIVDELIAQAEKLAQLSTTVTLGTAAPEIGRDVRFYSYKRWVILFRYEPHGIDVLRFCRWQPGLLVVETELISMPLAFFGTFCRAANADTQLVACRHRRERLDGLLKHDERKAV